MKLQTIKQAAEQYAIKNHLPRKKSGEAERLAFLAGTKLSGTNWIKNFKRKPKLGGEYNVVWNLDDGQYPVTTTMEWDVKKKIWMDNDMFINDDEKILYWAELPKPPKGISKKIWG